MFSLVLVACGSSHNDVETSSDEVIEDVSENDSEDATADAEDESDAVTEEPAEDHDGLVNDQVKEALIEAGVYGLDQGQEYSVKFMGEEFEFEHLGCRLTNVSNFISAEGPDNLNVYIEFNFDEEGTITVV